MKPLLTIWHLFFWNHSYTFLSTRVCAYVHVCLQVYVCMCLHTHVCICLHTPVCTCLYMHVSICLYTHACIWLHAHVCICLHMHVCISLHTPACICLHVHASVCIGLRLANNNNSAASFLIPGTSCFYFLSSCNCWDFQYTVLNQSKESEHSHLPDVNGKASTLSSLSVTLPDVLGRSVLSSDNFLSKFYQECCSIWANVVCLHKMLMWCSPLIYVKSELY